MKLIKLIQEAIQTNLPQNVENKDIGLFKISVHIFKELNELKEFNNKFRQIISNLKKKDNKILNFKLVFGHITPHEFVSMDVKEMASEGLKNKIIKIEKNQIDASRTNWNVKNGITSKSEFKCKKCRSDKTLVCQAQTRSADEPMTTFVTCLECGGSYKF